MRENLTLLHGNYNGTTHPYSLISVFVIYYLESIVVKLSPCKISMFYLASLAKQAGLRAESRLTGFLPSKTI